MEKRRRFEVHIRDKEERQIDCFTHKWVNMVTSRKKLGVSETLEEEQLEVSSRVKVEESVFRNSEKVNTEGDMQDSLDEPEKAKVPVREKLEEQVRLPNNFIGMPKGLEVPTRNEVVENVYKNAKKVDTIADQGGIGIHKQGSKWREQLRPPDTGVGQDLGLPDIT